MAEHHDSYLGFARHYDRHGWDWYAHANSQRLLVLLQERGLSGGKILDAGCGTGTLALSLASRGYGVTGIDLSEEMLAVARSKDPAGSVIWREGDITRFDLREPGGFDAILCVADTLNHLETLDEWEAAFSRFAVHLRPGGRLFIDAVTCLGLERLDKYSVVERDEQTLILGIIYERGRRRSTLKATSFARRSGDGLYERATETVTEWGQPVAGIIERLRKAGFTEVERPWASSPETAAQDDPERHERLTLLARRS